MAATLTREQMFAHIVQQDALKADRLVDTRRVTSSVVDHRLVFNTDAIENVDAFTLNDHAAGQVALDLGIPKRYFDRMLVEAPGLLTANVDHWLGDNGRTRLLRGFKPLDPRASTGTGRAWLSDRYKRLDNIEIAKRIFPVFDEIEGLTFHQAQITDTRFYLRAILPGLQADLKPGQSWTYKGNPVVGDVVQAGIEIRNSEVGSGALVIRPFILRLVCLNGMTVNEMAQSSRHVGKRIAEETFYSDEAIEADDNAFWLVARDNVKAALTEVRFAEITRQLAETLNSDRIEAPIAATQTLQQRYSLTDDEREAVLRNLVDAGDLGQWGMLNAITATAKEVESFDRQAELEDLGWTIAQLKRSEWSALATS